MTNPVQRLRLTSALFEYRRTRTPWFCEATMKDVRLFLDAYSIHLTAEEVVDFWTWFCKGHAKSLSAFTSEEVLWGIENFIDEFSPIDNDKYEGS